MTKEQTAKAPKKIQADAPAPKSFFGSAELIAAKKRRAAALAKL